MADALNCPTGASVPERDFNEWVKEGQDRSAPYIVRRGHFVLRNTGNCLLPRAHRINPSYLTDERIVFLVRDPRDIAVSNSHYMRLPINECLNIMFAKDQPNARFGPWDSYVKSWLDLSYPIAVVQYEDLLIDAAKEVERIFAGLNLPIDNARIEQATIRQSFAVKRARIEKHGDAMPRGKAFQLKFVRKGIAGDWRNHFTPEQEQAVRNNFGEVMEYLGYEW